VSNVINTKQIRIQTKFDKIFFFHQSHSWTIPPTDIQLRKSHWLFDLHPNCFLTNFPILRAKAMDWRNFFLLLVRTEIIVMVVFASKRDLKQCRLCTAKTKIIGWYWYETAVWHVERYSLQSYRFQSFFVALKSYRFSFLKL
jgi:hypothetical protein